MVWIFRFHPGSTEIFCRLKDFFILVVLFCSFLPRYPGSTFMDHVIRYEDTPGIKMIVVLGEVGVQYFGHVQC